LKDKPAFINLRIMAYNEELANRTREIISLTQDNVKEKLMFGGVCFIVDDKMCLGVILV